MVLNGTPEEQAQYRALNRLRMKAYRDKTRKRKYSPHPTVCKEAIKNKRLRWEEKQAQNSSYEMKT